MIDIIYRDRDAVVCIKPVGVLSQADEKPSMVSMLVQQLDCSVYPVHRLDMNVGGVMVFALNKKAAAKLSVDIQSGGFVKQYIAAVHGIPQELSGVMKDILFKDSRRNKSFVVSRPRKGTKDASLEYVTLGVSKSERGECSLVRIKLHTGRTHQIRVQFSSRKIPLIGDGKYGSKDNHCETALWSNSLTFSSPSNGEKMHFEAYPDTNSYPWNLFDWNEICK